jgi:hypothetical protein
MGEAVADVGDGMNIATDDATDSALDSAMDEAVDDATEGSGDGKVKDVCLRCADDAALGRGLPNGGAYTGIALLALVTAFTALHSVGAGI